MLSESGFVKTQGEILADLLEVEGYRVTRKSAYVNKVFRFLDTLSFLLFQPGKYDTVVIQCYGGLSFIMEDVASRVASWYNKKIIFTLHGGALPDFLNPRNRWGKSVFKRSEFITCPSDYLIHELSFLQIKMIKIPNVIMLSDYKFKARLIFRPYIFWMRAYHEIYNPLLALEVFERIASRYPDARLTMAGPDMGLLNEIKIRTTQSIFKDSIEILNRIDLNEKAQRADQHDFYLNTNVIDNTPVSMIEMAAFGLALVSTNVGGIPYLFKHNVSALLSKTDRADELAELIFYLIENPEKGKSIVAEAKQVATQFDWHEVKAKWEQIL
jgi:glycosyltransferase involved in cell wall biosynthesis